jgi:hypothetical protein
MLVTPPSLKEEHEEIMGSLNLFSRLQDKTGKSIVELLDVLEPHFEKEERLAMPILGTLSELASGEKTATDLRAIVESQGALQKEYDDMFEEHVELKSFIQNARGFAEQENHGDVVDLLDALSHHARVEEEVLYPAALLAGTVAKCLLYSEERQIRRIT